MPQLSEFQSKLSLPKDSIAVIIKILSTAPPDVLTNWLGKVVIRNGKIAGTYYADIKAELADGDFISLYEALGYNFKTRDIWQDWWCNGALGCTRQDGYTCDTETCHGS